MATKLFAPSMGEGVEELTVVNWLKKEGETVKENEMIVELETDKVTTEIPSPATGVLLKVLAKVDEVVKVGSTLAWIGEPGEVLKTDEGGKTPPVASAKAVSPPDPSKTDGDKMGKAPEPSKSAAEKAVYTGRISPLVKILAEKNNIDLNFVQGTGLDGRITKDDVLNYVESGKGKGSGGDSKPSKVQNQPPSSPAERQVSRTGGLIPHSSLRKQIAERMVNSMQVSPHVLTVMEADLSKVLAHRVANKAAFSDQGVNLTLTAYFCSAIVSGLKACPEVNSSWQEDGIQRYGEINLGIATSLGEQGLIVPVIKNAGLLSLQGLAQQINDLSSRARSKKLQPDEVKGGTFTLTNHGLGGSLFASPIIFQPQAAILGTGIMQKRAVVITDDDGNDAIAIRPMIYLSLVFDHRILDGEGADGFLKAVKESLENWS